MSRLELVLESRRVWRDGCFSLESWWPVIARALTFLSFGYFIALASACFLLEFVGERFWITALLLYVPDFAWMIPSFLLMPFCLVFEWKLLVCHLGVLGLFVFLYSGLGLNLAGDDAPAALRVVSNNIGENGGTSPKDFVERFRPDILAFQQAAASHPEDLAGGGAYLFSARQGEFLVLSRHRITKSEIVRGIGWKGRPVAARFEIDWEGRFVVLYNVHLPSRRGVFRTVGRGKTEAGAGENDSGGGPCRTNRSGFWSGQIKLAEELIRVIRSERAPVLIAGDFNVPDHGIIYRRFRGAFLDAFQTSGFGFGFTVPGRTRNPLSFFGPWLRLDYVFCNQGFRPVRSRVEESRESQHRGLFASFRFAAQDVSRTGRSAKRFSAGWRTRLWGSMKGLLAAARGT